MDGCQFSEVKCTNEKCQEKVLRHQLEDHTAKHCPYRLIRCPHCELSISLNDEVSGCTQISDLSVNKYCYY